MRGISNYSFMFGNTSKSSGLFGSFNYSDFSAIRNGSYYKLAKKQYGNVKATDSKTSVTNKNKVTKKDVTDNAAKIKSASDGLQKSVKAFNDKAMWKMDDGKYDTDKIKKAVNAFVASYNSVVDQVDASDSTNVNQSARWMNSLTNTMKSSLERIGVKLGDDNKLSVDEETFSKADMSDVKRLFSGVYSYANQAADKASSIVSAASRDTNMYSRTGAYSSMINSWFNSSI